MSETGDDRPIVDRPWFVLAVLFLVTGVLGLPLLWLSRGFRRGQKWFWTVVVTLYTLALTAAAAGISWHAYQVFRDFAGG